MNMFKNAGGFTLVELIVVIAILAILAGVAVPAYSGYISSANKAGDITALSAVKTAVMATYATEGSVVKVVVVDADAGDTITVWLEGDAESDDYENGRSIAAGSDFFTYYGSTTFDIDLKTGTTATWEVGQNDNEWTITTPAANP